MDDAELHLGLRINGFYGLREALETIHTSNQYVFDAAIMQVSKYIQPIARTFRFRQIQPKELFLAFNG